MSTQSKFIAALNDAKSAAASPFKLPAVCIVGQKDFDSLHAECLAQTLKDSWTPPSGEGDKELIGGSAMPSFAQEHDPAEFPSPLAQRDSGPDSIQRASIVSWFEFMGAIIYRSYNLEHGFFFA